MSAPPPRMRIFLVGVPRSGTTLLQALLAAHGEVTSFTESHFFSRPFVRIPGFGPVLAHDPTPRLEAFLAENEASVPEAARWFGPPTPWALRWRATRALVTRRVARRLVDVLDGIAAARGAPVWLEKTPRHLQALPLIERACRDGVETRYVHMVRDGLQTVASLHQASKQWERPYGIDECVARWNRDLALTVGRLSAPGHHAVRYEALTTDPEAVLKALHEALGLPWQPRALEDFGADAGQLTAPGERWKDGLAREIRPSATAERVLGAEQRRHVIAGLRHDLYDAVAKRAVGERRG